MLKSILAFFRESGAPAVLPLPALLEEPIRYQVPSTEDYDAAVDIAIAATIDADLRIELAKTLLDHPNGKSLTGAPEFVIARIKETTSDQIGKLLEDMLEGREPVGNATEKLLESRDADKTRER